MFKVATTKKARKFLRGMEHGVRWELFREEPREMVVVGQRFEFLVLECLLALGKPLAFKGGTLRFGAIV
jgi:hypothetical protein